MLTDVQCEVQLLETGGGLVQPGGSRGLSCEGSGFTFSGFWMSWVRQTPGKTLEWIGDINSDGSAINYAPSIKDRECLEIDRTSISTFSHTRVRKYYVRGKRMYNPGLGNRAVECCPLDTA